MLIFFMKISTWRISTITGLERLTELKVLIVNNTITILFTILFLLIVARLFALKVLNLAGNLIRKVTGVQNLGCVEELNLRWGDLTLSFKKHLNLLTVVAVRCFRRNRIRTTEGLQSVPSLQKLYMSNNEIQGLGSLVKLESLVRLQTLQMEGNPVWSNPDYSYPTYNCPKVFSNTVFDDPQVCVDPKVISNDDTSIFDGLAFI